VPKLKKINLYILLIFLLTQSFSFFYIISGHDRNNKVHDSIPSLALCLQVIIAIIAERKYSKFEDNKISEIKVNIRDEILKTKINISICARKLANSLSLIDDFIARVNLPHNNPVELPKSLVTYIFSLTDKASELEFLLLKASNYDIKDNENLIFYDFVKRTKTEADKIYFTLLAIEQDKGNPNKTLRKIQDSRDSILRKSKMLNASVGANKLEI